MRKTYCIATALMICAAMFSSCRNNGSSKKADSGTAPGNEVITATEAVLTDDVLGMVDELVNNYLEATKTINNDQLMASSIKGRASLVKPDYFLELSRTKDLLTKNQKINAATILISERPLRVAYGMPVQEVDATIARLLAEINYPIDEDELKDHRPLSEKIKEEYDRCKERGELGYFWQFQLAMQNSLLYLYSRNPELYTSDITEEQYRCVFKRIGICLKAARALKEYDPELAKALEIMKIGEVHDDREAEELFGTKERAIKTFNSRKDIYEQRRNALLD